MSERTVNEGEVGMGRQVGQRMAGGKSLPVAIRTIAGKQVLPASKSARCEGVRGRGEVYGTEPVTIEAIGYEISCLKVEDRRLGGFRLGVVANHWRRDGPTGRDGVHSRG